MVTEIELFESPDLPPISCLWGWTKSKVYKRKEEARYELLARILDAAAHIKKRRQRAIFAHEFTCIEVDSGDFRAFIVNCNMYLISV